MFEITSLCRLRIKTDGDGIRTLVVTHGCSLQCKYCLNPQTWNGTGKSRSMSAAELYKAVSLDRPYFMATNGGITFGGGEPLLYSRQMLEFRELCNGEFTVYAETSLNVPPDSVKMACGCIDRFFVDIKTLDPGKYQEYTKGDLSIVLQNLAILLELAGTQKVMVRIPVIPGVTSREEQLRDRGRLLDMGVDSFDLFSYRVPSKRKNLP